MLLTAGLVAWLATVSARALAAPTDLSEAFPADACEGRPVTAVVLEGCAGTRCEDDVERAKLLAILGVRLGAPYTSVAVVRGTGRLLDTRFFHTATPRCEPDGDGVRLVVDVQGTWVVRRIVIEGSQYFYDSDIRKRVFLRPGSVLDPRPAMLAEQLQRQKDSIRRVYVREGFARARVDVSAEPLPGGLAELRIRIDEGPKDRIGSVRVQFERRDIGNATPGCPTVTPREIRSAAGLARGDVYTDVRARRARKGVLATLRALGYVGPTVGVAWEEERARLTLRIGLDRCYDVAVYRRDAPARWGVGYVRVDDEELRAALPFAESGAFDLEEAELGRQALEELYEARGHLFADVRLDYRDYRVDIRGTAHPDDVIGAVHYYVTEDAVMEIRDIALHGARVLGADTVRAWMETRVYDFFGDGGYLQVQRILWDLGTIRDRYRERGFLRFRYARCQTSVADVEEGGDAAGEEGSATPPADRLLRRVERGSGHVTVNYTLGDTCFSLVRPDDEGSVYVHVFFEEGPRSRVASLTLEGHAVFTDDEVRAALLLAPGGAFSAVRVARAVERLKRAYHARGIYPVEVDVACEGRAPVVAAADCRVESVESTEVALTVRIREGARRELGDLLTRGNFRTAPGVFERDLPEAGAPYDEDRLQEGMRKLRDLGVFESIKVTPVGLDEDAPGKRVALVLDVEEGRATFVDVSIGFETLNRDEQEMPFFVTRTLSDGIAAADQRTGGFGESPFVRLPDLLIATEVSYVDQNFLGRAKELQLPLKYGFSTTALDRLASFLPTYLDSRFFGYELRFRLTPFLVYDRATQALDTFQYGFQTEISKQLTRALYTSLEYELSNISIRDPRIAEEEFGPYTLQNTVSPRIAFDRTDHPLNPTEGYYLGASLSYINAYREAQLDNFLKWELVAKGFLSLRDAFTVAVFARYGDSVSFDGGDLPETERYRLGGSQGLRGFADDAVRQYTDTGAVRTTSGADGVAVPIFGGDTVINGSVELRFPLLRSVGLWGAGFFDWGGLAEALDEYGAKSFRMSLGLGVRWLAGGQIPIRFDYGIVLGDLRCKDAPESGECTREDRGTIHFGILYTF